jgi:hypothetical protein
MRVHAASNLAVSEGFRSTAETSLPKRRERGPFRKEAFEDGFEADPVLRFELLASRLFFGDKMMHGGQDCWDLAIHNAPDQGRIGALVIVDQNVAEVVHLAPRDLGMSGAEFSPDLPGCLPDNLEVPAHGVQENARGHGALVSQDGALAEPLAAVQNVKKVNPWIRDRHALYRLGISQN